MSQPFHHKHPYLSVLVLLVVVLAIANWVSGESGDRGWGHDWRGKVEEKSGRYDKMMRHACDDDAWVETKLFMGQGEDGGIKVNEADWLAFLEDEIRPCLPDGFTVLSANGYWGAEGQFYSEDAKLLLLLHDDTKDEVMKAISDAYLARFQRGVVLRADDPACVRFISRDG